MQRVLDAALFEPGAYASPDAADAWFAPAPEKATRPSTAPAPKENQPRRSAPRERAPPVAGHAGRRRVEIEQYGA